MYNGCPLSLLLLLLLYMQRLKWHYHRNAAGALYKQQCHISHVCSHSNSNNWHNHIRASLKDAWNNRVFICRLNAYNSAVLTDAGRAFQAHAAATGNAWSPSVVRHVVSTSSVDVDPEHHRHTYRWTLFLHGFCHVTQMSMHTRLTFPLTQ